jgi:hypothetical protein
VAVVLPVEVAVVLKVSGAWSMRTPGEGRERGWGFFAEAEIALRRCGRRARRTRGAPERNRTSDTGFRRAVLYPLSYEGGNRRESN